jgi:hypothetical protein
MNAVEIEAAISALALQPFDGAEFPFAFLAAFGNKETTIKRLRKGDSNTSDVPGGVLQRSNIHIAVCELGRVGETLTALRESPKTVSAKAKFILATDGETLEAEDLASGETVTSDYSDFGNHFGFFLPLAGISTIKEIKDNPIDVRATGRLNKLYIELLKDNPEWATEARRHDMNHFMARLIFCFFAEDTDIFNGSGLFTRTVEQMSARDSSNTHEVIGIVFRVMSTKIADRTAAKLPLWACSFPYVNGGLFSGSDEAPHFSRMARTYLLHAGQLNWREINPDIFGSMIQAVADDEERGAIGMHYTSVPNMLKVLNPLFLDDLRGQLNAAGDNTRMLLNLRRRMSRIRVFDPACGSGNFLVTSYKEMRKIEAEINRRRGEELRATEVSKKNFRGIEIRDFAAEVARLALVIAEYQCDVLHRGSLAAKAEFLPLDEMNWITCGNALRLNWLEVCPPEGTGVRLHSDDLFQTPLDQAAIDFENAGGETYICGNPPYIGSQWRNASQQQDMDTVFRSVTQAYRDLDYVACWYIKAANFLQNSNGAFAYVATKTICQGIQVAMLWPLVFSRGLSINFAHRPFKWANLAKANAGVTCVIVGVGHNRPVKHIYEGDTVKEVRNIGPYLIDMPNLIVEKSSEPINGLPTMDYGNKPSDGGYLILSTDEAETLRTSYPDSAKLIKKYVGSQEFINGTQRFCLWIVDSDVDVASSIPPILERINQVRTTRLLSKGKQSNDGANIPHKFVYAPHQEGIALIIPSITSENRNYLPVGFVDGGTVISNKAMAAYRSPIWLLAIVASRLHWVWIGTVCVRMRTDFSYSNTLGWNTFPVPTLTEQNKTNLMRCAEDILLAREAYFPATIADLYDPDTMPESLRRAHERNDEVLERIYIGRRFRNDTERLEKLFELYTKMTAAQPATTKKRKTGA